MDLEKLTEAQRRKVTSSCIYKAAKDCMPIAEQEYKETGDHGSIDVLENWIKIAIADLKDRKLDVETIKRPVIASEHVTFEFKKAFSKHMTIASTYNE